MGTHGEFVAGLVEADVAVVAQTQQLQVDATGFADGLLVRLASSLCIRIGAVGDARCLGVDVDMVEKVLLHEVAIALVVLGGQAAVLVQVERGNLLEADTVGLEVLHQVGIQPDGRGAGGQAQRGSRVHDQLGGDQIRRATAHILVGLLDEQLHVMPFLSPLKIGRG